MILTEAAFTDWLTGVSGALVFVATVGLATVAVCQMRQLKRQATVDSQKLEEQIAASVDQGKAIKEAARAELQPMVFAQIKGSVSGAAIDGSTTGALLDLNIYQYGFTYLLANEGTGLALNVTHGVRVGDIDHAWEAGMHLVTLRPSEVVPPNPIKPLVVSFDETELEENWGSAEQFYWVEFSNVFNDRFRTVVSSNPLTAAEFIRLKKAHEPGA